MRTGFSPVGSGSQRRRDLHGLVQLRGNIPRQQFVNAIDRMIGNAFKHVVQVALRIDVIELTALDETVDNRRTLTAAI